MNKKLLALAVGAAFALPVAASAAPTLYGKIDVALESVDNGNSTAVRVTDNASRFGLRGDVETSKKGLKGIYKAEFGLQADDGSNDGLQAGTQDPISQRDIYVGLAGDFGTVIIGQADTPTKVIQGSVDQFNDTSADMGNLIAGEVRAPNVVAYSSPKLAGAVTVHAALWQSDELTTASGPGSQLADATSLAVQYQNGGLYAAIGFDADVPTGATGPGTEQFAETMRFVLGYNSDKVELGFLYQTADYTNGTVALPAVSTAVGEDVSMLLSGAYKTGAWKLKGQYISNEFEIGVASVTTTQLALGADYALSKTTTVGGFYSFVEDDATPAFEQTTLSLGLSQKF